MSAASGGILALDFDGVVCDAFDECALVTWLGVRPPVVGGLAGQLAAVPDSFRAAFATVRNYSRLLDHFVVAHQPGARGIASQAEFDAAFESLTARYVADFVRRATAARAHLRTTEPEAWLDLHMIYDGVPELLQRHSGPTVIVTAKDEGSVRAILERQGLIETVDEIHGECGTKEEAVVGVAARWGTTPATVTFVDDNLANVLRVSQVGARARWAQWGYQTPEHRVAAAAAGVTALQLADLGSLIAPTAA